MSAVAAVVLAAGAGRRMGDKPKALLATGGETWLARAIRVCEAGGCASVWVVARAGVRAIGRIVDATPANLVFNADADRGMFSSAQEGIRAALEGDPALAAVILYPVDHPSVHPQTVAALIGAVRSATDVLCIPTHGGTDGHPIAIDPATARALLRLPTTFIMSHALKLTGAAVHRVAVDDPGVLDNVNTPAEAINLPPHEVRR